MCPSFAVKVPVFCHDSRLTTAMSVRDDGGQTAILRVTKETGLAIILASNDEELARRVPSNLDRIFGAVGVSSKTA